MNGRDVLKVSRDRADLSLLAGDYLVVGPDGLPLCVIRKFDPDTVSQIAQALGIALSSTLPVQER